MGAIPVELTRHEGEIEILWSDRQRQRISFQKLRDACPCAQCVDRSADPGPASKQAGDDPEPSADNLLPVLPVVQTGPIEVVSMIPVGNYAYKIGFSDGHQTGIYPFRLLRELET